MVTQVVEINQDGHYLSKFRGFMAVHQGDHEAGRVPLDDMTALILSAHQITLSKALMVALAERKVPIITCGRNYHPLALSLPYDSHFDQTGILWSQIECSQPLAKRLWQSVVREKISNQKTILDYFDPHAKAGTELAILVKRVKSGDPENMEAQAARHYWPALLGKHFRRDRHTGLENMMLNYGYSVLRAATARAICAAGLTPALGIHHHNRKNPFALVDDLMEPFRPLVDKIVRDISTTEQGDRKDKDDRLTAEMKKSLAGFLDTDVQSEKGISSVMNGLHQLVHSFVSSLEANENRLKFPKLRQAGKLL